MRLLRQIYAVKCWSGFVYSECDFQQHWAFAGATRKRVVLFWIFLQNGFGRMMMMMMMMMLKRLVVCVCRWSRSCWGMDGQRSRHLRLLWCRSIWHRRSRPPTLAGVTWAAKGRREVTAAAAAAVAGWSPLGRRRALCCHRCRSTAGSPECRAGWRPGGKSLRATRPSWWRSSLAPSFRCCSSSSMQSTGRGIWCELYTDAPASVSAPHLTDGASRFFRCDWVRAMTESFISVVQHQVVVWTKNLDSVVRVNNSVGS